MKAQILIFSMFLGIANASLADSAFINMKKVTQKSYSCSNGGTIKFSPTRSGNVWKLIYAKEGSLNQLGVVSFYNQTDYFRGDVTTWMTFPQSRDEDPQRGRTSFYMEVRPKADGLEMTMESARDSKLNFVCHNY